MTICKWCNQNMDDADTCLENIQVVFPDNSSLNSSTEHFNEESTINLDKSHRHVFTIESLSSLISLSLIADAATVPANCPCIIP